MTKVAYDKPFLTIDEQVDRLESRGMVFPDRDRAPFPTPTTRTTERTGGPNGRR